MSHKKILIVDDDPRNIFALTATLKSRSYTCISCLSATEALAILKVEHDVDAILIDMMMPEMDGYDAIPLIKALPNYQKTPVVAVTAQAMRGDKEKCLEAGADHYISKPINVDLLLNVLNSI